MRKLTRFAAIATLLAIIAGPTAAFAHGDGDHDKSGKDRLLRVKDNNDRDDRLFAKSHRAYKGTVTAVGSANFDLKVKDDTVLAVNVSADTKLLAVGGKTITLADIKIGDNAVVQGKTTDSKIEARHVVIWPANTHPAGVKGTVTAVSDDTITIEKKDKSGITSSVTVKTDSETVVKKDGEIVPLSEVTVGETVKIKGLWDRILKVLKAIKIRIK